MASPVILMSLKRVPMCKKRAIAEAAVVAFCIVLWLGTSAKPVHAYADPGTGLMAIQILGAAFAGFLFFIRKRIINLFSRIRKLTGKKRESPESPSILPPD
jgi:hypothetical protein